MATRYSVPKGTRDFLPDEMQVRSEVIERLRACFELYGYGELDTPAFETFDLLSAKSGEAVADELYVFEDKGGRRLALRFEFTASLGRVLAGNLDLPKPFKRYQIGKVWRYERPQLGRYREFYQADVDVDEWAALLPQDRAAYASVRNAAINTISDSSPPITAMPKVRFHQHRYKWFRCAAPVLPVTFQSAPIA